MKTLLFLLLSISATAQIGLVPKVVYKATKADTITVGFSCSNLAELKIFIDNEILEDVTISGYHVLELTLDSGSAVIVSCKGSVAHTVYRNGVNVTPVTSSDNTEAKLITYLDGLSISQYRKRVNKLLIKYLSRKELIK
jgi:hypothetical protein